MWIAILLTILASTGNNVGKALQKSATAQLPRLSLQPVVLYRYLSSREWLAGLMADLGGGLLMIAAVARAPVSIVQPVSGVGLALLAVFSHFYLKERLQRTEWSAVFISSLGTIGLGATSGAEADADNAKPLHKLRILVVMTLLTGSVLAAVSLQHRRQGRQPRQAIKSSASAYGLQAGACFGLSAAACRTGFLLSQGPGSPLWVPVGIGFSALLTSCGFLIQTRGLKDGNTVIICTCAAVASMISGVLVGLLALGESLPSSSRQRSARLASWLLIAFGVALLANGQGGHRELRRVCIGILPQRVKTKMPPSWSASFKAAHQKGELPIHSTPA